MTTVADPLSALVEGCPDAVVDLDVARQLHPTWSVDPLHQKVEPVLRILTSDDQMAGTKAFVVAEVVEGPGRGHHARRRLEVEVVSHDGHVVEFRLNVWRLETEGEARSLREGAREARHSLNQLCSTALP